MSKIYEAIQVSIEAHKDQLRKIEGGVYVAHPLEVGMILSANGADDEVVASGILHDTIEDTTISKDYIRKTFGKTIADYVDLCTEPQKGTPWQERKEWVINNVKYKAPYEVKLIICADKLSNIRSIHRNLQKEGDEVWDHFHAPYEKQKWYYTSMLEGLEELSDLDMYKELELLINEVFKEE